jgi:SOS-response transcriptional repressor LexA
MTSDKNTPYAMQLADILARIESRQKVVGLSDHAASLEAGLSRDAIRSMRRGLKDGKQEGVQSRTIRALAAPLHTTPEWLMTGEGPESLDADEIAPRAPFLEVVGEIAAGVWIAADKHLVDPPRLPYLVPPDPMYSQSAQFALIMRGSSFNRYAADGDAVICIDVRRANLRLQNNDLVLAWSVQVGGSLREITARRLHLQRNGTGELTYESTDDRFASTTERVSLRDEGRVTKVGAAEISVTAVVCGIYRSVPRGN